MHLLIPYALPAAPDAHAALASLTLPHTERLLARMQAGAHDMGDEFTCSPPHERAWAALLGLGHQEDGRLPWAAHALAAEGRDPGSDAWAWITPCHWRVAVDHITMLAPEGLQLAEPESRAFMALAAPYFVDDGIGLEYAAPTRWRARGEVFRHLATASLDRVTGRSLDLWMPDAPAARGLRRLQSEMQMLLYTSPLNDARQARGLPPVNSFWISGTGAWPTDARTSVPDLHMPLGLREAALRDDWSAWARAWADIDATEAAAAAARLVQGGDVSLTLCGDRGALTFGRGAGGIAARLTARIAHVFAPPRLIHLREQL